MAERRTAPFGTWKSPISSDLIVGETIGFGQIAVDGTDIYWTEQRPSEGGRSVLVCRSFAGVLRDITPVPFNVRTRVHEYGGGAFAVSGGVVFFTNFADQRLYRQVSGAAPQPISAASDMRYADAVVDRRRDMLFLVREDHTRPDREAVNTIVSLTVDGSRETVVVSGSDFYSSPRLAPDGRHLAWLSWNHPHMPWDGTELWAAPVADDGSLGAAELVAGGGEESIFQPEWSPGGVLHWVSDRTGWWNLYRRREGRIEALRELEAEFGLPQWVFGMTTYGFAGEQELVCAYVRNGAGHLALLDAEQRELHELQTPFIAFDSLKVGDGFAVFCGGSAIEPEAMALLDLSDKQCSVLRRSSAVDFDAGYTSVAEHIAFPTGESARAYGYLYRPVNRDFRAPEGERPPLHVHIHGGPTGATSGTFSPSLQFWTSRGIAVLDVDYRGSTGYGTAYRRLLNGMWGVFDVEDCVNGAKYLADEGVVDGQRLLIAGGSAGGYTTLAALTFHDAFSAGASYYGVSDVEALAQDTHKFESRYLDSMIGPLPEKHGVYVARSPIYHTDKLNRPLILFQGLEDRVVPPAQAVRMYEAVKAKGLPVAYVPFEGEQHGFRQAQHIKRALDAEFYFYAKVFGYIPADEIEPVEIVNLP